MIGNGFDLQHGIPSKLADFKDYLEATGRNIYQAVETYLPTEEDWSDLELALAALDVDLLIEDLAHFMGSYTSETGATRGITTSSMSCRTLLNASPVNYAHRHRRVWWRDCPTG